MTHEQNVREGREEAELLPTRRNGIMWNLLIDLARSVDKLEAGEEERIVTQALEMVKGELE